MKRLGLAGLGIGLALALAGALGGGPAAAAPSTSAPPAGLGLTVTTAQTSYHVGEPVTITATVSNRTARACQLSTVADGGLEVLDVTRDGAPVEPVWGRRVYFDGYSSAVQAGLRSVPSGGSARVSLTVNDGRPLTTIVPDLSNSALRGRWAVDTPGAYDIRFQYTPAAGSAAGTTTCAGASNEAVLRMSIIGGGHTTPWALVAGAGAGGLIVLLVAGWALTRRRRPASRATAVALLVVTSAVGIGLSGQRPAHADIDLTGEMSDSIVNTFNHCLALMRANDPAGIMDYFDSPSSPPVHVQVTDDMYKMNTDSDARFKGGNSHSDITVTWDPVTRGAYHTDGLPYDPCSGLAHEMSHAYDFAHDRAADNETECDSSGVDIGQTRAIIIENIVRAAQHLPPRHYSGTSRAPDQMDTCNEAPAPASRVPSGYYGACGGPGLDGCGHTTGDPHLTTFDGRSYDLQSVGEFVLARGGGDLEIQTRQAAVPGSRTVAVNTAVVARIGTTTMEFDLADQGILLRRDGMAITLGDADVSLPGGGALGRHAISGGVGYTLTWPDRSTLWVDPIGSVGLAVLVAPATARAGTLTGLLGNDNHDPRDDLVDAAGALPDPAPFDRVHAAFADHWRVTDATSLFTYPTGQSTATFTRRDFPGQPASSATGSDRARAVCAGFGLAGVALDGCVLDVTATGDTAFATAAASANRMANPAPAPPTPVPTSTATASVGPSGALRDGDAVHGHIATAGQRDRYHLDLQGADTFYVADWTGPSGGCDQTFSVNLVDISANNYPCRGGVVTFHPDHATTDYQLEIASTGGTGSYSFVLITAKDHQMTASIGDTVVGHLDQRGQVDDISFNAAGATAIRLSGLPADCTAPLTYLIRNAGGGAEAIHGADSLCGTASPAITLPDPAAKYTIEISSGQLQTGTYSFRLERAT